MTAIRGYVAPTSDEAAIGIHSLDQFVLAVPDLKAAQHFYVNFGLNVKESGNTLGLETFGHDHRWGSVVEAKTKALHHLSFGCYAEDLPRLKARIEGNGVKLIDPPPGFESNGIWFRNHENVLIEVKVAPKSSPDGKSQSQWTSAPAGVAGAAIRKDWPPVRPRRLCLRAPVSICFPTSDRATPWARLSPGSERFPDCETRSRCSQSRGADRSVRAARRESASGSAMRCRCRAASAASPRCRGGAAG